MKHVVTGAQVRQTVLVTGFGAFPGAGHNPTGALVERLERRHGSRLARLGVALRCEVLPVVYAEAALRAVVARHRPDAILHLGLASRRRHVSVETRAINRASALRPDAARACPAPILAPGGPSVLRATYPAPRIVAALARAGIDVRLSIDAGDYVCNATLYRSLLAGMATRVGFIHVPRPRGRMPGTRGARRRPSFDDLSRATLAAVLAMCAAPHPRGYDGRRTSN